MLKPGNEIVCWHFYWKSDRGKLSFCWARLDRRKASFARSHHVDKACPWGGKPAELD